MSPLITPKPKRDKRSRSGATNSNIKQEPNLSIWNTHHHRKARKRESRRAELQTQREQLPNAGGMGFRQHQWDSSPSKWKMAPQRSYGRTTKVAEATSCKRKFGF
jgi:hypothetical protein